MLCPFCGTYAGQDEIVCPSCGKLLPRGENLDTGVMAIRQGKRAREEAASGQTPIWMARQGTGRTWVDPESRPTSGGRIPVFADPDIFDADGAPAAASQDPMDRRQSRVYGDTTVREEPVMGTGGRRRSEGKPLHKRWINWMRVLVILLILAILGAVGTWAYLKRTPNGQRIMARMGREATSAALWEVGEEQMNTGDLTRAIANFEKAAEQDGEDSINVAGYLLLASAYEAEGRVTDAEEIYVRLYTDVVPSAIEPYANEIRIMMATGREPEAAELMTEAYRKTGSNTFMRQRTELLPQQPTTDQTAGSHTQKKTMHLTSPQGYDIYYILAPAQAVMDRENLPKLPDEGTKYEDGIFLDEGYWMLRAVCVNGNLVSDELSATYRVELPSPDAPYVMLAPNTYKTRQRVRLRPGEANLNDTDITIYYTIDGSIPNADSPIYDGKAILLPGGKSTIRAVAVNGYGKFSNTVERSYKIEARPWPKDPYVSQDVADVKLNSTTYENFVKVWGEEERREDVTIQDISAPCRRYFYPWGYVTYQRVGGTQYLIEISTTSREFKAPRNTQVGMSEEAVLEKFCDMGQVESPSGNRGLYSNEDGTGRIIKDADGSRRIEYIAYTVGGYMWQLDYLLDENRQVKEIYQRYLP